MSTPEYKRGTVTIGGKLYGFNPDGTRYRLYPHREPFLTMVAESDGSTTLRVRQSTELGYATIPVGGVGDLAYPTSQIRRARTVGGGHLVNALTCSHQLVTFVEL